MHHAIATFGITALASVILPRRCFDQLPEGTGVAFLNQVTRLLPAEEVVSRVPPRRTFELPFPLKKEKKQRRLIEAPAAGGIFEDFPKQIDRLAAFEEMFLVGGPLVAVPR